MEKNHYKQLSIKALSMIFKPKKDKVITKLSIKSEPSMRDVARLITQILEYGRETSPKNS